MSLLSPIKINKVIYRNRLVGLYLVHTVKDQWDIFVQVLKNYNFKNCIFDFKIYRHNIKSLGIIQKKIKFVSIKVSMIGHF